MQSFIWFRLEKFDQMVVDDKFDVKTNAAFNNINQITN